MSMGLWFIGGFALIFAVVIPATASMFWEWYDARKNIKTKAVKEELGRESYSIIESLVYEEGVLSPA